MPTTTPTFNYNQTIGSANILNRISQSTGINNLSNSSIIKQIAAATSSDVAFTVANQQYTLNQVFGQTATGQFLDYKGADYGLYRNIQDNIIIFAVDQAISLQVADQTKTFGQVLNNADLTIPAGTGLGNISNSYSIVALEDTVLNPSNNSQYISVKISLTDTSTTANTATFSVTSGQIIPIGYSATNQGLYNSCQMQINQDIIIETQSESDDQYRQRIQDAKTHPSIGTVDSISLILDNIPQLLGYSIVQNPRGKSSLDFNIVTQSYIDGTNYSFLPAYIGNLASTSFSVGTDISVQFPTMLKIFISYTTGNAESVSNDAINSVIQTIFNTNYLYSQTNTLVLAVIENAIKAALPQLTAFKINSVSGYDAGLGAYVINASTTDTVIPLSYFCYIDSTTNLTNLAANGN